MNDCASRDQHDTYAKRPHVSVNDEFLYARSRATRDFHLRRDFAEGNRTHRLRMGLGARVAVRGSRTLRRNQSNGDSDATTDRRFAGAGELDHYP